MGFAFRTPWRVLTIMLGAAFLVRLLLLPIESFVFDRAAFTEWIVALQTHPLSSFYSQPFATPPDHLPGTLWLLFGMGKLISIFPGGPEAIAALTPEQAGPFLKGVPIVADLINGVLLFAIARRFSSERRSLVVAAAYLFNPGVIFVSAIWGQWDAISMTFVLLSILIACAGSIVAVLPILTVAVLMKPQLALLAPMFIGFLIMRVAIAIPISDQMAGRRVHWNAVRHAVVRTIGPRLSISVVISIALVTLAGLPFRVALLPIDGMTTFTDRLAFAADRYHGTTYGAISLWLIPLGEGIPPNDTNALVGSITYALVAWMLVLISTIGALVLCARLRWSPLGLIAGSSVALLGFSLFATRTHERYLFPAVVMILLLAGVREGRRFAFPAVGISLAFFGSLFFAYAYFDDTVPFREVRTGGTMSWLGVLGVTVFVVTVVSIWKLAEAGPRSQRDSTPAPTRPTSNMATGATRLQPSSVVGGGGQG